MAEKIAYGFLCRGDNSEGCRTKNVTLPVLGRFRMFRGVPIPQVTNFVEPNARLLECCRRRWSGRLRGHDQTLPVIEACEL